MRTPKPKLADSPLKGASRFAMSPMMRSRPPLGGLCPVLLGDMVAGRLGMSVRLGRREPCSHIRSVQLTTLEPLSTKGPGP